jgi:predicted transcriptional regulator
MNHKIQDAEEMKQVVVKFGTVKKQLKDVMDVSKSLRAQKTSLTDSIRDFMETNQLDTCKIQNLDTNIRRIKYIERESKEPITIKLIEEWFKDFFEHVDTLKFINLSSDEKTQAFFEFLETKRRRKILKTLMIT